MRTRVAQLDLSDGPPHKLVLRVPQATLLGLYQYCLWRGTDGSKVGLGAARMIAAFLERDRAFQRWRAAQADALPTVLPADLARPYRRRPPAPAPAAARRSWLPWLRRA